MKDDTPPAGSPVPTLAQCAVSYAHELVALDIREGTRNSSPWIDRVLAQVHAKPGDPWCAAALYEIFLRAARAVGVESPCPRSAGALRMYALADERFKIGAGVVRRERSLLQSGSAFFEDHSGDPRDGVGSGHCGIVLGWTDPAMDLVDTISGNVVAADSRSREGTVLARQNRPIGKMLAFLDFERT
jgi:hypothetical protein